MWYEDNNTEKALDYSKPIMAFGEDGVECLMLPHITADSYNFIGYDWFALDRGCYNSRMYWVSPNLAVDNYKVAGYTIKNVKLVVEDEQLMGHYNACDSCKKKGIVSPCIGCIHKRSHNRDILGFIQKANDEELDEAIEKANNAFFGDEKEE